jgi:aspartate kinase
MFEDKFGNANQLNEELQQSFITQMTKNVSLFTVRNAELEKLDQFYKDKKVLLEQISKKPSKW